MTSHVPDVLQTNQWGPQAMKLITTFSNIKTSCWFVNVNERLLFQSVQFSVKVLPQSCNNVGLSCGSSTFSCGTSLEHSQGHLFKTNNKMLRRWAACAQCQAVSTLWFKVQAEVTEEVKNGGLILLPLDHKLTVSQTRWKDFLPNKEVGKESTYAYLKIGHLDLVNIVHHLTMIPATRNSCCIFQLSLSHFHIVNVWFMAKLLYLSNYLSNTFLCLYLSSYRHTYSSFSSIDHNSPLETWDIPQPPPGRTPVQVPPPPPSHKHSPPPSRGGAGSLEWRNRWAPRRLPGVVPRTVRYQGEQAQKEHPEETVREEIMTTSLWRAFSIYLHGGYHCSLIKEHQWGCTLHVHQGRGWAFLKCFRIHQRKSGNFCGWLVHCFNSICHSTEQPQFQWAS